MKTQVVLLGVLVLAVLALMLFGLSPSPVMAATCTWTGGGGDGLWATSTNWSGCTGGGAPASTDDVLLDNSSVAGSYAVVLPGGAVTTSINKLTITPGSGNTITLTLPSSNTGNPGFNVGDNASNTDDIILNAGAVLINSSGSTTSGTNGIQVNSLTNGTVRINNGGKYIHNTGRSTAGVVPLLSTVAGTETGIFEYDSPGTSSVSISASGRNYGSLTLTRTAGAATYTATGGSPLTIRGDFTINSGVTFNNTMTGNMRVAGTWTNNGVGLTGTSTVGLNGTAVQSIGGSSSTTFANLTISNTVGVTLTTGVSVTGALSLPGADLFTGSNTLTLASGALITSAGDGDVFGNVRRSESFAVGPNYTFNNPNTLINFSNVTLGSSPTITVTLTPGKPDGLDSAVTRGYTVTTSGLNSFTADLRLRYKTGELGGVVESNIGAFEREGGGSWTLQTGSVDTLNHFATISDTTTFSEWALSDNGAPTAVTLSNFTAQSDETPVLGILAMAGTLVVIGLGAWGIRTYHL